MDQDTFSWAQEHLHTYLPAPSPCRHTDTQPETPTVHTLSRTKERALQLSAAAHFFIQSTIKHTNTSHQMPKELPENLTCFLLGLSSLGWGEWHLLTPIWQVLHKQPNKTTREVTLCTFFLELGGPRTFLSRIQQHYTLQQHRQPQTSPRPNV